MFVLKVTAMDFNVNGDVERNDAFLLARANLDMARFIRNWRVTTPDHQNSFLRYDNDSNTNSKKNEKQCPKT